MYLMAAGGVFGGEDSPKKILDEKSPRNLSTLKKSLVKTQLFWNLKQRLMEFMSMVLI
ncbi:MAG: hypothetical protein Ct9H90mP7_1630 [Candidatus Neomarinimicrobiota bacterium]|nr:MAG: hypothetical protein Ct9H90mP7_1630 [Candidatus Neomarinimicrobiota bacterium]